MPTLEKKESLLSLTDVTLCIGARAILKRVSFSLMRNEILTLIGPNGAGKSCLIKVVVGLLTPTSGTLVKKKNLKIGYMPQKLHINPLLPLTVNRFLSLGRFRGGIDELLELLGVLAIKNAPMTAISGGEFQRVLLARALLGKPDLLVLDEPAQGVDLAGQEELYALLKHLRDLKQFGILVVSHDLNFVMADTDRVVCLNGHVCCMGHPDSVRKEPAFIDLFGHRELSLARYTHHHDHQHGVHGDVVDPDVTPKDNHD